MRLSRLVASVCGAGYAPRGSGTAGSFVAVLAAVGLLRLPPWGLPVATIAATAAGLWAIAAERASDDPGWVVIDEVAGQWLTLLPLAFLRFPTAAGLVLGFLLFRLFDIAKPGPIGRAERLPGAIGVMADDLAAGLAGALVLWGVIAWWGGGR